MVYFYVSKIVDTEEPHMKLEKAIEKCFDRCNLAGMDCDIIHFMYQYKAIRELPPEEFDRVYDELATGLGFMRR